MDAATIRQYKIRTMPDWELSEKIPGYKHPLPPAALWASREGIDPPPSEEELQAERQRRSDLEVINQVQLPAVLAAVEWDGYFVPSLDKRPLRSLVTLLWCKDERRMRLTDYALTTERIRRGLPLYDPKS